MIKKLKLKFVLNNMLLVSVVLVAVFSTICLLNYAREETKLTDVLDKNIEEAKLSALPQLPSPPNDNGDVIYDASFTVLLNEKGEIITQMGNDISEESFRKAVSFAFGSDRERGTVFSQDLSFKKVQTVKGTLITFISREHLKEQMKDTVTQSILAAFVCLLMFLYISKRLADLSIAPIEEAWLQQKQFLADASHDLKTPITVILANQNIISSNKESTVASQMKWIESTNEEAVRMSELVNSMLELSKNEAVNENLKFGEVNVSEAVENAILQFEVVAFERNITIESGIQPSIVLRTHRTTFSKVLEILFDNAIKYSNEGGKISVALYQSAKKVYFTINNGGECIKKEDIPHIFERFYRTNKERKVGGHGLGLALAKKKCDLLGIKISVDSNELDGTTFTLTAKTKNKI